MNGCVDKSRNSTKSFIHNIKGLLFLVISIVLSCNSHAESGQANETANEYAVKAAYIYNILRFVSWPESSPLASTESLSICLFKKDPFNHYLDAISGKTVGNKPIRIKTIIKPSDATSCHLVFIKDSKELVKFKANHQLKYTDSILLGNDIEFVENGGLFSFYIENNKVRLGANRTAIDSTRLKISSMLIEVCKLYGDDK